MEKKKLILSLSILLGVGSLWALAYGYILIYFLFVLFAILGIEYLTKE